jgi:hypothetical protein
MSVPRGFSTRPIYVAMGINLDGEGDVLGLWVGPAGGEGAKFWMTLLTELRNRGIQDNRAAARIARASTEPRAVHVAASDQLPRPDSTAPRPGHRRPHRRQLRHTRTPRSRRLKPVTTSQVPVPKQG